MGGSNEERVLINEKPNQGVRERKKVGIHCASVHSDASCWMRWLPSSVEPLICNFEVILHRT
jgi:hypothetical protein